MTNLSEAAKTALINAGTSRLGTNVTESGRCTGEAARELRMADMIGVRGGLTRKGQITRENLLAERLDDAFGPL